MIAKPCRMWMRRSSSASSNSNRRRTVSSRKFRNSRSIAARSTRSGPAISRFSVGTRQVRLTWNPLSSGVCL